jgi:hypothetical protein
MLDYKEIEIVNFHGIGGRLSTFFYDQALKKIDDTVNK